MVGTAIRAVSFDVGNTLLACDPPPAAIYAQALSRFGRTVSAAEVEPVFTAAWAAMQLRCEPGRNRYAAVEGGERAWWGLLVAEVLARLEHEAPLDPLLEDLYAQFARPQAWRIFPEVREVLASLRAAGMRLAVTSNWDARLPALLDDLGLAPWFEVTVVSALEGFEKPSGEIFARLLDRLDLPPDVVLHVGDSPLEDYHGARAAGLHALLVDRRGLFAANGHRRVSSLAEVPRWVDSGGAAGGARG